MALLTSRDQPQAAGHRTWPHFGAGGLPGPGMLLALGVWLLSCGALPGQTHSAEAQEYQVKAAFLYNFAKFVDWSGEPGGSGAPLVIAVFGRDPFGSSLEQTVWGKTVNGRPLLIRRTSRVEELFPCHILFISSSEKRRLGEILQALGRASVLTVSDMEEFLQLGGIVRFLVEDNKVRFGINLEAARRTGLKISSKLLSLAKPDRD